MRKLEEALKFDFKNLESREEPVTDLSDIDLNEAKKVADSLRAAHRARRRHGSETVFNKNIIDSAKKTLNKFGR